MTRPTWFNIVLRGACLAGLLLGFWLRETHLMLLAGILYIANILEGVEDK